MRIQLATEPVDARTPNEDFAAVSSCAAVLLDGAGMPPGMDSGCSHGVTWYTRTLGATLLGAVSRPGAGPLSAELAEAIARVRSLHEGTCDLSHAGTPSATVVAVRARDGWLDYLVLSDSVLMFTERGGEPRVICDDRLEQAGHTFRAEFGNPVIGTPEHSAALREFIGRIRARTNTEGGSWVAAGDPAAAGHAVTGRVALAGLDAVMLLTDGACRLVTMFDLATWADLAQLVAGDGPEEAIRRTRAAEASDPYGQRWPRGKARDDATIVILRDLAGRSRPWPGGTPDRPVPAP